MKKCKNLFLTRFLNTCLVLFLTLILSGIPSFATERVFFYHTDPVGTPLVMTNEDGYVVWEADYLPFGEEYSETSLPENNRKFVGKEKDDETGLYYFSARYLDAGIGRFTQPDPLGITESDLMNPQRFNRYAYSLNNPYRYLDSNGKWPEQVHNSIITSAFSGGKYRLSENAKAALMRGSAHADSAQYQDTSHSYMHAMRAPGQSPQDSEKMMNEFIKQKVSEYKRLMSKGKPDKAYEALGMAMHPLMDATSPSHESFQEWAGVLPVIPNTFKAIKHGVGEKEKVFNSSPDFSRRSVDALRKLYDEAIR
jgi:RHS repeat-associated protein